MSAGLRALDAVRVDDAQRTRRIVSADRIDPQRSAPHAEADFLEESGPFAVLGGEREVVACAHALS